MPSHEYKQCPRCGTGFDCKPGLAWQCQCAGVLLGESHREFIAQRYDDCLCAHCLRELRTEHNCREHARRIGDMIGAGR